MKYPRTFHLSFSPEIHSDDKTLDPEVEKTFLEEYVVISEKLDGGNTSLEAEVIYPRSHSEGASHGSYSMLKKYWTAKYYSLIDLFNFDRYAIYGENMQAIHSIEYSKLEYPFYMFNVLDKETNEWLGYKEKTAIAAALEIPFVPLIGIKKFSSLREMKKFLEEELKKESAIGGPREGFVIQKMNSFHNNDFETNVCKYVRAGHVQTDKHWSRNWKPQKFI